MWWCNKVLSFCVSIRIQFCYLAEFCYTTRVLDRDQYFNSMLTAQHLSRWAVTFIAQTPLNIPNSICVLAVHVSNKIMQPSLAQLMVHINTPCTSGTFRRRILPHAYIVYLKELYLKTDEYHQTGRVERLWLMTAWIYGYGGWPRDKGLVRLYYRCILHGKRQKKSVLVTWIQGHNLRMDLLRHPFSKFVLEKNKWIINGT